MSFIEINIPTLCVVCVSERRDVVNMSSLYYGSIPASTFIMDILQIKVASDTSSGVVMCNRCNSSLNNFYKFYKMVRDAQHKYNEMKVGVQPQDVVVRTSEICFVNVKAEPEPEAEVSSIELEGKVENRDTDTGGDVDFECMIDGQDDSVGVCKILSASEAVDTPHEVSNNISESECNVKVETDCLSTGNIQILSVTPAVINSNTPNTPKSTSYLADLRSYNATKAVLAKYKPQDIFSGGEWKISEEEKDEIFQLYIDMKCNKCDAHFSNYNLLNHHCMTDHGTNAVVYCDNKPVPSYEHMVARVLHKHIFNRKLPRIKKRSPCKVCNKLIDVYQMEGHLASHLSHDKREFHCDQCNNGFATKTHLTRHIASIHSNQSFICPDCGKSYKSQQTLNIHIKKVHSDTNTNLGFLCPDCGKRIVCKKHYETHVNEHRGIVERVKCPECDALVKASGYHRHKRSHIKKQEQCPHCSYKGSHLFKHIQRVHEKPKPYTCAFCPMTFCTKKNMEDHIASRHTGIPRYTCEFCSKTFMSSGNHHLHRKRMHPEQLAEKRLKMAATSSNDNSIILEPEMLQRRKYAEGAEVDVVIQNLQSVKEKKMGNN